MQSNKTHHEEMMLTMYWLTVNEKLPLLTHHHLLIGADELWLLGMCAVCKSSGRNGPGAPQFTRDVLIFSRWKMNAFPRRQFYGTATTATGDWPA